MSLFQVLDEIIGSQNSWIQSTNDTITDYQRKIVSPISVDLYAVPGGMELHADLPGMDRENITLEVKQNMVTLAGERKYTTDRETTSFHHSERYFGTFTRKFRLPFIAEPNTVTAKYNNGVLSVFIPEPTPTNAGQINIE